MSDGKRPAALGRGGVAESPVAVAGVPYEEAVLFRAEDARRTRRRVGVLGAVLAMALMFTLCIRASYGDVLALPDMLDGLVSFLQWKVAEAFQLPLMNDLWNFLNVEHPYARTVGVQLQNCLVYCACGVFLALAGMLFQNVFRNPMASPNMLGVSAGMNLGLLLLVYYAGTLGLSMIFERYILCGLCSVGVLVAVLLIARLSASRAGSLNVGNVVLIGAVSSSLVGAVVSYFTYTMTDEQYEMFTELQEAFEIDSSFVTLAIVLGAAAACLIPIFIRRFNLNVLTCTDEEMRLFGADPLRTRMFALVLGTVMMLVAQIVGGMLSMIALVVPFVSRALFGSEFRKQILGNVFLGAILFALARDISTLVVIGGTNFPGSLAASIICLPAFIYLIASQQRTWEG